jgi:hypothetical protein
MKYKDFEILRFSDVNYDGMTTEVCLGQEPIIQLNMDKGAQHIEIHLLNPPNVEQRFPLSDFLDAIDIARRHLLEYPDPTKPRPDS